MAIALVRSIGFGFVVAALATSALAAGRTLSVTEKADLPVPPAKVWEALKDYNGWQNWHPAIASTEISKGKPNTKGTVRVLTTKDGAKIKEELLAQRQVDELQVPDYRLAPAGDELRFDDQGVEVQGRFRGGEELELQGQRGHLRRRGKKVISGIYTAGLDNLKSMLK